MKDCSKNMTLTVVVYRSTLARFMSGAATMAILTGVSVANHRYGGGTVFIDALAVALGFATLLAMVARQTTTSFKGTKQEAIEYLTRMN